MHSANTDGFALHRNGSIKVHITTLRKPLESLPSRIDVVPLMRLPAAQRGVFTYNVPAQLAPRIRRGAFVRVPFRNRRVWGLVVHAPSRAALNGRTALRAVIDVHHAYACTEEEIAAVERIAALFRSSLATTAYLTLPSPPRIAERKVGAVRRSLRSPHTTAGLRSGAQLLSPSHTTIAMFHTHPQRLAVLRAVAGDVIRQGQSVLILTPHRAWFQPIQRALRDLPCVVLDRTVGMHNAWQRAVAARESGTVILGTRSAAFTAPPSLGAIIIDLAEDDDYKQEDAEPRYDARDVTAHIAKTRHIPRLLLTAAPKVTDWTKDARRMDLGPPPHPRWTLVDLLAYWRSAGRGFLTESLTAAIERCRADGRVAVLLHNRRGRMRRTTCRDCGATIACPSCRAPLVEYDDHFRCPSCSARSPLATICPSCRSPHLSGRGIGTVGLIEALHRSFPDERIGRMDRDVRGDLPPSTTIVVGSERFLTAVAPSFDRSVGLVAVVHAERYAVGNDYRADERLAQALRGAFAWAQTWDADTLVQTSAPAWGHWPAFPVQLARFYRSELAERSALGYPPAARLLRCDYHGTDAPSAVPAFTRLIAQQQSATLQSVEGPVDVRSGRRTRTSMIIRLSADASDADIAALTATVPPEWSVDVDPATLS